jgi:hypothetical protein
MIISTTTTKEINLSQLDEETGNHGLNRNFETPTTITVSDNSPVTKKELDEAIKSHIAKKLPEPSIIDKLALVGLNLDDLKIALGL